MRYRKIHESDGQRSFAIILQSGDEVMSSLQRFANDERILGAQLTGIGAFSDVVLLYFDWQSKQYSRITIAEQVEVASFLGDIAEGPDGKPALHVHLVVGKQDGRAMAGHLGEAHVSPTLEVIVTDTPAHLRKKKDRETGLALIDLQR